MSPGLGLAPESHAHPCAPGSPSSGTSLERELEVPGPRSRGALGTFRSRLCPRHPCRPHPKGHPSLAWTQPGPARRPPGVAAVARRLRPAPPTAGFAPPLSGLRALRQVQSPREPGAPRPVCVLAPHALAAETRPRAPARRRLLSERPRPADWACSAAGRPGAAGAERMPSRGRAPAVQGRGTQAAAVADARASLRRTRARMASLTAYGNGGRSRALGAPWAAGTREPSDHPGNFGVLLPRGSGKEGAGCSAR